MTPSMTDEEFAQNASGVAMKYKLLGLEDKCGIKESFYKEGIQRRLELIFNILNLMGNSYDYRAIDITFIRNLPSDLNEMADIINKLSSLYSDETLMTLMPIDVEYEDEKEKRKREIEEAYPYTFEIKDDGDEDEEDE